MVDSTAPPEQVSFTTSRITARNGQNFLLDFFHFPETLKKALSHPSAPSIPHIVKLALTSFPHWTDNGDTFTDELSKSKYLSLVKTNDGTIVGFSQYTSGTLQLSTGETPTYMYAKYVAIDPGYRKIGLMRTINSSDVLQVNPDIIAGCSAVGEIHQIMRKISIETKRVFFPSEVHIPPVIGDMAKTIYALVYGEEKAQSINVKTLVRRGITPYAQGSVEYEFFKKLHLGLFDGVMYLSLVKSFAERLNILK